MWSLLLSVGLVSATISSYYGDVKDFKCYNQAGSSGTGGLTCHFPVNQLGECFFFAGGKDTVVQSQKDGKILLDARITKVNQPMCSVNFNGSCTAALTAGGPPFLCYKPVAAAATFAEAAADCKKTDNGQVYVPSSDSELERLLGMLPTTAKTVWIGGGTIFFRSCGRQLLKEKDAVEVATIFTREQKGTVLGYSSTRLATEK